MAKAGEGGPSGSQRRLVLRADARPPPRRRQAQDLAFAAY